MKRLCLFAGFDKQGVVDDYVVYYVKELSKLADVYYYADCAMREGELAKLAPYVKGAHAGRHEKYDFGSWQELMKNLSWEKITEYDQLILANDSCYGPMFPLAPIFDQMENRRGIDFWGMTKSIEITPHLQSYFLVFNSNVVKSKCFQTFFEKIKKEKSKKAVVRTYEIENTLNLEMGGFKSGELLLSQQKVNPMSFWKMCLDKGIPILKVCTFTDLGHAKQSIHDVKKYIINNTNYDYNLIKNHLDRLEVDLAKVTFRLRIISLFWVIKAILRRSDFLWRIYKKLKKDSLVEENEHEL